MDTDTNTPPNNLPLSESLAIEEYKRLVGIISGMENQIVYITSGTVVVSVTILTAVLSRLFSDDLYQHVTVVTAYIALAPCFIFIPALFLIVAHRNELCRAASYLRVFYEENLNKPSWDSRVSSFRRHVGRKDAHDPIPYIFWAIAALTIFLFIMGILYANASCIHYLTPIVPVTILVYLHWRYHRLLSTDYENYLSIWQQMA